MADVKELNINSTTYDIKAKSVVDQNSGSVKMWTGTKAQYDAIVTKDADTLYDITDTGQIYKGTTLISDKTTLYSTTGNNTDGAMTQDATTQAINSVKRNIGEIVTSTIPLTDAGLHLLDGGLINGDGIYSDFVDYVGNLYTNAAKYANVQTVGNLSTTGNVLSGFSNSNYAIVPAEFNPASNTWGMVFKFTTGSTFTDPQPIFSRVDGSYYGVVILISNNANIYTGVSSSTGTVIGEITGSTTLSANTTYYAKLEYTGSAYNLYLSTDGETYTSEGSITSSTAIMSSTSNSYIGLQSTDLTRVFTGSIDLNESYIDIDGERWWDGTMPHLFINEAQWQYTIALYGECGKFVYTPPSGNDPATVRLPKIEGITQGTHNIQTLGDLVEAGLPNITGGIGSVIKGSNSGGNGALLPSASFTAFNKAGSSSGIFAGNLYFDASNSSSIYGNSSTVQPQTIKILYYIVISNSTKTEIEVDIDEIATDLNGKADTDLSNLTATSSTNFDGQWVMFNPAIVVNSTAYASGTATSDYDISSHLPSDNYDYEIMVGCFARATGTAMVISVQTDLQPQMNIINERAANSTADHQHQNNAIIPLHNRTLSIIHSSSANFTSNATYLFGYRRIGTNQ